MTNNDTTSYTLEALAMCRRELQKRLDKVVREIAACDHAEQAALGKLLSQREEQTNAIYDAGRPENADEQGNMPPLPWAANSSEDE